MNLEAVLIVISNPIRQQELADVGGHLPPATLRSELAKFDRHEVPVKIFHIRPLFFEEVVTELETLGKQHLNVLHGGETFRFSFKPKVR